MFIYKKIADKRSIYIEEKLYQIKKFDKKIEAKQQKLLAINRYLGMKSQKSLF